MSAFFFKKIIIACMLIACFDTLLFSKLWAEDSIFKCEKVMPGIDLNFSFIRNATDVVDALELSGQGTCFDKLTLDDRIFLKELSEKMIRICKEGKENCERDSLKLMDAEIKRYQSLYGKEATERIIVALLALKKKEQISHILKLFQDSKLASSFKNFSVAMLRYEHSLANVTFKDINVKKTKTFIDGPLTWLVRKGGMAVDLVESKIDKNAKTRFNENNIAAQNLLFSTLELNSKIQELNISADEKNDLLKQVQALNDVMRSKYETEKEKLQAEESAAFLLSGGLASATAIVASAGIMGPAVQSVFLGKIGSSTLTGLLGGAIGSGGITGVMKVSEVALVSSAKAENKATNFLCELGKNFYNSKGDILKEIFGSTINGALWGGAFGGSLAALVTKSPEMASAVGILLSASGAGLSGMGVVKDIKQMSSTKKIAERIKKEGGSSGDVIDAQAQAKIENAYNQALLIADLTSFSMMVNGVLQLTGRPHLQSKKASELLKRPLTLKQQLAIEKAHLIGKGELGRDGVHPAAIGNYTFAQLRGKAEILKTANFSKQEIRQLMENGIVGFLSQLFGTKDEEISDDVQNSTKEKSKTKIDLDELGKIPPSFVPLKEKLKNVPLNFKTLFSLLYPADGKPLFEKKFQNELELILSTALLKADTNVNLFSDDVRLTYNLERHVVAFHKQGNMEFTINPSRSGTFEGTKTNEHVRNLPLNPKYTNHAHNVVIADEKVSRDLNTVSLLIHELSHAVFDYWLVHSPQKLMTFLSKNLSPEAISKLVKVNSQGKLEIDGDLYDLLSERYAFELQYRFDTAVSKSKPEWPSSFNYTDENAKDYTDLINSYVRRQYDIDHPLLKDFQVKPLDDLLDP